MNREREESCRPAVTKIAKSRKTNGFIAAEGFLGYSPPCQMEIGGKKVAKKKKYFGEWPALK